MKNTFGILAAIVLLVAVSYGSWQFKRWFNYKVSYQSQVQAELQPLTQRIADLERWASALERRVSVLETNKENR